MDAATQNPAPPAARRHPARPAAAAALGALAALALVGLVAGLVGLHPDGLSTVTLGGLVTTVLATTAGAATGRRAALRPLLRTGPDAARSVAALAAAVAVLVAVPRLWGTPVVDLPAVALVEIGGAALLLVAVAAWPRRT